MAVNVLSRGGNIFDMVNMDGRMYDLILGRFMTPDPFVQMPDFTQSLNRYSYCMNNHLSLTDPTGYSWLGGGHVCDCGRNCGES